MDGVHQKRLRAVVLARFDDAVSALRAYAALFEPGEPGRLRALKQLVELEAVRHGFEHSGRRR
jgi:hypothetical protein